MCMTQREQEKVRADASANSISKNRGVLKQCIFMLVNFLRALGLVRYIDVAKIKSPVTQIIFTSHFSINQLNHFFLIKTDVIVGKVMGSLLHIISSQCFSWVSNRNRFHSDVITKMPYKLLAQNTNLLVSFFSTV